MTLHARRCYICGKAMLYMRAMLHARDVTCAGGVTYTKITQNKHHTNQHKNLTHCFILNRKELPTHWLTIADVFCDVVCDVICNL